MSALRIFWFAVCVKNIEDTQAILLTVAVTVASAERSFSKLKIIKKLYEIDDEPGKVDRYCNNSNRKRNRGIPKVGSSFLETDRGMVSSNTPTVNNQFHQKAVRVAVLGADTLTGEMVAYLLKQNPIVSQIYLYGDTGVFGISADLRHFDTRSGIKGYCGRQGLSKALRRADIVVLVGSDKCSINADAETRLRSELDKLVTYADACTKYAPKSLIAVCVRPVSTTMPIVSDIFRNTHWYHPGRIVGSAALTQTRINSYIGLFQDLDPRSVHVPIIGGPDTNNVVPLLSRALPATVLPCDVEKVYKKIKDWKKSTATKCEPSNKVTDCRLSEAYSINQLVTTMALGLCGDDYAIATAFVRQNIIPTCRYLVTTVQFGPSGVIHNFGIPRLTKFELTTFEKATNELKSLEEMALNVLSLTNAVQNVTESETLTTITGDE